MKLLLVGAGGHAKAIHEAAEELGHVWVAYVDPQPAEWLSLPRLEEQDMDPPGDAEGIVMGLGGVTPERLQHRFDLFRSYRALGFAAPPIVHPAAWLSATATIGDGAIILAQAVVQPNTEIGEAVIVNTGAIVEHDSRVGPGSHIAPAATVLGAAWVGATTMIGAGAIVLPGAEIGDASLVRAST